MQIPGLPKITATEASNPELLARAFNDMSDLLENVLHKGLDPVNNSRAIYLRDIEVIAGGKSAYDLDGTQPAAGVTPAQIAKYGREYFDIDISDLGTTDVLNVELLRLQELDGSPHNGFSFRWRIVDNDKLQARIALSGFASTPTTDYPYPTYKGSKRKMRAWILITGGPNG